MRLFAPSIALLFLAACGDDGHDHSSHDAPPAAGKARDVVCGMEVATPAKHTATYKGTVYSFCADDCRAKFEAKPTDFKTGQPGEKCVCSDGAMEKCNCNHCGKGEKRCPCWDPKS